MSPIYIRPAREQAEHDRLIGFLEAAHDKKYEVLTNKGDARDFGLKVGTGTYFPDLILQESKKPVAVIEIETGESTNKLEALAQWVHFGKSKVPFHLYVPVLMYDAARRFCEQHQVAVTEIWTYRPLFEGFDLVRVFDDPQASKAGKGPAAKVVVMPKVADAPKPQPALEAVEEILARIGSREAAKQASREAARAASKNRASRTQTTPKAAKAAPVAPPGTTPAPPVPVRATPPAKAGKPPKAVAKAASGVTPKTAKPAKPAKSAKAKTPVRATKTKGPVKKAPAKKVPARKAVVKKAIVKKPAARKTPAKKAVVRKTAVKKKPIAKSKKR